MPDSGTLNTSFDDLPGNSAVALSRLNTDVNRLRRYRTRPEPDLSLQTPLRGLFRNLEQRSRKQTGIDGTWKLVLPAALAEASQVVRFSRGTLTIRAANASARYQIDRFLRSGGEAELARRAGVTIRRVKYI